MKNHSKRNIICFCIVALVAFLIRLVSNGTTDKNVNLSMTSILSETLDMAELSTAEFRYKGIADVYADEKQTRIMCRVCYDATVKAGIDVDKLMFDINNENKTIRATLPEINYKVMIIDKQSMDLLPSDADVDLNSMLKASREDAEREAIASPDLLNIAEENLKSTIEGLLYQILKTSGYSLTWN